MTFQFSLWDKFKDLSNLSSRCFSNLVQLVTHLLHRKCLSLSILKVIFDRVHSSTRSHSKMHLWCVCNVVVYMCNVLHLLYESLTDELMNGSLIVCMFSSFHKAIEFGELDKPKVKFLKQVLSKLLKETEPEDLVNIFGRWVFLVLQKWIIVHIMYI